MLLDEDELSYGVSLNVLVSMLAEVAGTGIGGLIISCLNINAAFVVDIATFVLSIVMIWMIMKKETSAENLEKKNSLIIFKEGLQYVKSKKILIRVILFAVFANAVMAPIDSLQTPVVVDILKQNATYLSLLNICLTVGVLLKFCGMDKVFLIVAVCIVIVLTAAGMLNNTSLYKK